MTYKIVLTCENYNIDKVMSWNNNTTILEAEHLNQNFILTCIAYLRSSCKILVYEEDDLY